MPVNYLEVPSEARALRMHIQQQTLAYAKRYITTDYVEYTEEGVAEIFSTWLDVVSPLAPTDISLPVDPLDKLLRLHEHDLAVPYDEDFVLRQDEGQGVRNKLRPILELKNRPLPSLNAMLAQEPSILDTPFRPLSPILTARAQRETPKLLYRSRAQVVGMLPCDMDEVCDKARIHPVHPTEIQHKTLNQDDCLDLNYAIAPELVQGVRAFMARVSGRADASVPVGYEAFLRAESPSIPRCFPRPMSPPLFPRSKTVGSGRTRIPPDSLDQILDLVGSPVEAAKFGMEEIAQENMRMLCGNMDYLPPSSPPTLPPLQLPSDFSSSDAAQPSSPPRTPMRIHPSEVAFIANEILFPKNQQRGRKLAAKKDPQKLADVVSRLHQPVAIYAGPPIATIFVPGSPSESDSLVGQADAELDELAEDSSAGVLTRLGSRNKHSEINDDTLVSRVVERLTQRVADVDPLEYVIKEKMDDKDVFMLDVPDLAPPNQHALDGPPAPTRLADLMGHESGLGLGRVGGLQSLQLELEWRVTMPGQRIPTHEQAARVDSLYPSETKTQAKDALKSLQERLNQDPGARRVFENEHVKEQVVQAGVHTGDALILTKQERRRVFGPRNESERVSGTVMVDESAMDPEDVLPMLEPPSQYGEPRESWDIEQGAFDRYEDTDYDRLAGGDTLEVEDWFQILTQSQAPRHTDGPAGPVEDELLVWSDLQPKHSAQSKLALFMRAQGRTVLPTNQPLSPVPAPAPDAEPPRIQVPPIPKDIQSMITIDPYEPLTADPEPFRIIASMQVIQHRALVQHLQSPTIRLDLVERWCTSTDSDSSGWQDVASPMHGAALVLDPCNAVVFVPLAELAVPDGVSSASRLVQHLVKRFECVYLIFEAYSKRATSDSDLDLCVDPFGVPGVRKGVGSVRRIVALVNGASGRTSVKVGVARTPYEAAQLVRGAVDCASFEWRTDDVRAPEVWGTREWVQEEAYPDEWELGEVVSMNVFAAVVVLAQVTVDQLFDMTPEERSITFAPTIGDARVDALNEVIVKGQKRVEMSFI